MTKSIKHTWRWPEISGIETIATPALIVSEERIRYNIDRVIDMVGDISRLRPHIKTVKSVGAVNRLQEAGIEKFKCATIAEAELLGKAAAPDVLLSYQPVGANAARFVQLIRQYPQTQFSCLVDNEHSIEVLSKAQQVLSIPLRVFIDINVGMNRTGILPDETAEGLITRIKEREGLSLAGVHAYDGHIHDADLIVRRQKTKQYLKPLLAFWRMASERIGSNLELVVGGSPTFTMLAGIPEVTCSPGTFVYWDAGYQEHYPEQQLLPAAALISRIVSKPGPDLICLDLGHKAVASENALEDRFRIVGDHQLTIVSQSEEHLVLRHENSEEKRSYAIGEVLYLIPYHICPTVALHQEVLVVSDQGELLDRWENTARNRRINI